MENYRIDHFNYNKNQCLRSNQPLSRTYSNILFDIPISDDDRNYTDDYLYSVIIDYSDSSSIDST